MNQAKTASYSKYQRSNAIVFAAMIGAILGIFISWLANQWLAASSTQQLAGFSRVKLETFIEPAYMARHAVERHSSAAPFRPHRIAILGDSTAAGTGASAPQHSVAGLIGAKWSEAIIENHATNGATIADVVKAQLPRLNADHEVDLVLVMVGGNDVIRASSQDSMSDAMKGLLQGLQTQAARIVIVTPGDVGSAPRWFKPVGLWLSHRSRVSQQAWRAAIEEEARCSTSQLIHVDLAVDPASDLFRVYPDLYYSADGLHPNDAGYRVWYEYVLASLEHADGQEQVRSCVRV
jgi:lysophospholipase L1-like esterase